MCLTLPTASVKGGKAQVLAGLNLMPDPFAENRAADTEWDAAKAPKSRNFHKSAKARQKYADDDRMFSLRFLNRVGKVCALTALTLILPSLAYADRDNGKPGKDNDHGFGWGDHDRDRDRHIPTVPDSGPGVVILAASIGAVLLFSATLNRKKA